MGSQDQRLQLQLEAWRKDLINLTRANRLLYLKPGSALEVAEPIIPDVFGKLASGLEVARSEDPGLLPQRPAKALRSGQVRFKAPAKSTVEAKLKSLDRAATQTFMDRGLWTLYLAIGVLQWEEAPASTGPAEKIHSPLLLVPVSVKRSSLREPFRIQLADEEQRFNPALKAKLLEDFGVELRLPEDDEDLEPSSLLETVAKQVAKHGWLVQPRVLLSTFSFHKEPILRDLIANEGLVTASEAVRGIALGGEAGVSFEFDAIDEARVDEAAPPEQTVTILDADSSQRRAIAAASAGKSFVMDGPPGTGKSQTIANMIADLLARQRTVLFVSDKAAALDVVRNRLAAAGLAEFVLELHSHKATRKEVARELGRSLQIRVRVDPGMPDSDRERLRRKREQLNNYVLALNEPRMPLGQSLHRVLGRIAQLQALPQAPPPRLNAAEVDHAWWAQMLDLADALGRAWGPVSRADAFHWRELATEEWGAARRVQVCALLEAGRANLEALDQGAQRVARSLQLDPPDTTTGAERLHALENFLQQRQYVHAQWLSSDRDLELEELLKSRRRLALEAEVAANCLVREVGTAWPSLHTRGASELSAMAVSLRATVARPTVPGTTSSTSLELLRQEWLAAANVLRECGQHGEVLGSAFGQPAETISFERTVVLAELASLADRPHRPERDWFAPSGLRRAREAAARMRPLLESVRGREAALRTCFKPEVLQLDLETLCVRFGSTYRGLFRWLNSDFRRDRKALIAVTRSGKLRREEIDRLSDALEWQRAVRALEAVRADVAGALGHFLQGEGTDLDAVESALELADDACKLAGASISAEALGNCLSHDAVLQPIVSTASRGIATLQEKWVRVDAAVKELGKRPIRGVLVELAEADKALLRLLGGLGEVDGVVGRAARLDDAERWLHDRHVVDSVARAFEAAMADDINALGPEWQGAATKWARIEAGLDWARSFKVALGHLPSEASARHFATVSCETPVLGRPLAMWAESVAAIALLFGESQEALVRQVLRGAFSSAAEKLTALLETVDDIGEWHAHVRALAGLSTLGLGEAAAFCRKKQVPATEVRDILERAAAEAWADDVLRHDARLTATRAEDRDALARDFRKLDRELIQLAARDAISACSQRRPKNFQGAAGVILAEAEKQRRHMPVRTLIGKSREVVQAIKPCFMMSPLSVSQFLPADCTFDVVIFDEASQVKPADAISSIYRGRQLVVAGDQRQLPPSAFFERLGDDGGDDYDEDAPDQFESVLDKCKGSGVFSSLPLRWHYRSQHEHLIAYSNYSFYDGRLITFPGAVSDAPDLGVEVFHCDGVYRRGGQRDNPLEAQFVAQRVLFHAQEHPELSIGVVAFSEAQASTIDAEIERLTSDHPELVALRADDRLSGLFVKNLETVQGDERDVIIFSMGFGRDEAGKFTMNFGPLTKKGGERRLNVAITRARRKVEFVTSVRANEFASELSSDGARHLRRYLEYAERREERMSVLAVPAGESVGDFESPFEVEVARTIRSWGYEVVPQVGCSDYRIDLGVRGGQSDSRFILGVECDGAMYHSSRAARDRDRLRAEVLRRLGWQLHRIWGPSWYRSRADQERRLREAIERAAAPNAKRPKGPAPAVSAEEPQTTTVVWNPNARPSWARVYRVAPKFGRSSSFDITDDRSRDDLERRIFQVLEAEGPIQSDRLVRQVIRAFGVDRAGARVQDAFDCALDQAKRSGKRILERERFLWLDGKPLNVRVPDDADPDTRRSVSEVSPQELEHAIVRTVEDALRIDRDDLMTYVARLFGWDRKGAVIVSALQAAIRRLIKRRAVVANGTDLLPSVV